MSPFSASARVRRASSSFSWPAARPASRVLIARSASCAAPTSRATLATAASFEFAAESREFVSRFGLAPFLSREGGGLRIEFLFLFRQGRRELLELPFAPREPFLRGGRSRFHALVSLSEFPRSCREGLRLLFVRRLRLQDLFLPAD